MKKYSFSIVEVIIISKKSEKRNIHTSSPRVFFFQFCDVAEVAIVNEMI
jgi:hypothetical protein